MRPLRLALRFLRLNILIMAQYPLNLAVWSLFGLAYHLAYLGVLWAMLRRFGSLGGWTFADMLFLYALWALAHGVYSLTLGKTSRLSAEVRAGRFDRYLARPLSPLFQLVTAPEGIVIDDLIAGIALFLAAQAVADVAWSPAHVLLLALITVGGALLKGGLLLALSTFSFWVVRMDAARLLLETVEVEVVRFPLAIFPPPARFVLTFVLPFAFVSFFPAQLFLEKQGEGTFLAPGVGYLTPAVGLTVFLAAAAFWSTGLRRYQSTGS